MELITRGVPVPKLTFKASRRILLKKGSSRFEPETPFPGSFPKDYADSIEAEEISGQSRVPES